MSSAQDPDSSRTLLSRLGYRVHFRVAEWTECLLVSDDESFVGRGEDAERALADAVRAALPSRLARALFEQACASVQPVTEVLAEEPSPPVLDLTELAADPVESAEPQAPETRVEPTEDRAEPTHVDEERSDRGVEGSEARTAASEKLRDLHHEIRASLADVAVLSPERQRLQILGWMCTARALGEVLGVGRHQEVAAIASELGALCKTFWPGSVPAMRLDAIPQDVLGRTSYPSIALRTWADAAGIVQDQLDELVASSARNGEDEDGWCDTHRLTPRPRGADAMLVEVASEVAELVAGERGDDVVERACAAAARLRWLRRATADHTAWGRAMGALRRWSNSTVEPLERVLHPRHVPTQSWSSVIGGSEHGERRARQAAVIQRLGDVDDEGLGAWIREAIDVMDGPELSALLHGRSAAALRALGELRESGERRLRRRASDIAKRLSAMHASEAHTIARALTTKPAPPAAPSVDPHDELVSVVKPHTAGKNAVLVTNRASPELERALLDRLGLSVETCEVGPRRLDGLLSRIAQRRYDLVLSATGFQDHSVDGALSRACRSAGVPMVRTDRSRPLACIRAIARELGLQPAAA